MGRGIKGMGREGGKEVRDAGCVLSLELVLSLFTTNWLTGPFLAPLRRYDLICNVVHEGKSAEGIQGAYRVHVHRKVEEIW